MNFSLAKSIAQPTKVTGCSKQAGVMPRDERLTFLLSQRVDSLANVQLSFPVLGAILYLFLVKIPNKHE